MRRLLLILLLAPAVATGAKAQDHDASARGGWASSVGLSAGYFRLGEYPGAVVAPGLRASLPLGRSGGGGRVVGAVWGEVGFARVEANETDYYERVEFFRLFGGNTCVSEYGSNSTVPDVFCNGGTVVLGALAAEAGFAPPRVKGIALLLGAGLRGGLEVRPQPVTTNEATETVVRPYGTAAVEVPLGRTSALFLQVRAGSAMRQAHVGFIRKVRW